MIGIVKGLYLLIEAVPSHPHLLTGYIHTDTLTILTKLRSELFAIMMQNTMLLYKFLTCISTKCLYDDESLGNKGKGSSLGSSQ